MSVLVYKNAETFDFRPVFSIIAYFFDCSAHLISCFINFFSKGTAIHFLNKTAFSAIQNAVLLAFECYWSLSNCNFSESSFLGVVSFVSYTISMKQYKLWINCKKKSSKLELLLRLLDFWFLVLWKKQNAADFYRNFALSSSV